MKKSLFAAVGVFLLFASCRKDIGQFPSENPLTSKDYQVVEYHRGQFDDVNEPVYIFPFKKKYDPSGKTVVEIDGSYDEPAGLYEYKHYSYREMKVSQKGRMVYLIDMNVPKSGIPDTLMRITLNAKGRPESSVADSTWLPVPIYPFNLTQTYIYKNNRIVAVHNHYSNPFHADNTDSLVYDQYGDLLSFDGNYYEYDYSHPVKQQFYCEAWQPREEPFYYLQFLGYFPEVTSPPFIMTRWRVGTSYPYPEDQQIADHKFDSRGRLISYDYGPQGPTNAKPYVTITWK